MPTAEPDERHAMTVRMRPALYAQVAFAARALRMSANAFTIRALERELDRVASDPRLVEGMATVSELRQRADRQFTRRFLATEDPPD